jgi:hypothetical protein
MQRPALAVYLILALFVAILPPGLCPCWLMPEPAKQHPHFDWHPERPHGHNYLFDLFQSQTVPALLVASVPLSLLIALQAASGLRRRLGDLVLPPSGWAMPPLTPPPRL